ncbi:MAG: DUF2934 domain-containing protein [Planctomycetota bacterium]
MPQKERRNGRPSQKDLEEKAYALYLAEGCPHGRAEDNWRMACQELCTPAPEGPPSTSKARPSGRSRVES